MLSRHKSVKWTVEKMADQWKRLLPLGLLGPCLALAGALNAGDSQLTTVLVANIGFPVFLTHAPCDFNRLFVVGKFGRISIIKDGAVLDDPFLDLTDLVVSGPNEQGLLGLAFHPDFETNGFFYVNYTRTPDGDTVVARYAVSADPDVADPDSVQPVMLVEQPTNHHNAGWIGFGPNDGYLYIALGDGGGEPYDTGDNAQNLDNLLGSILRIDVDCDDFPADPNRNYGIPPDNPFVGIDGADEIWAYGLRNPWRCSLDRETGDLYIGDVGQDAWEEVNFRPGSSAGGENYGWDCKEGTRCTAEKTCDCTDPTLVDPMFEYAHASPAVVIGGYVYRGCAIPDLVGAYLFADLFGRIWRLEHDNGTIIELREIQDELAPVGGPPLNSVTSFGEDAFGELYLCDRTVGGKVFKIVPAAAVTPDCNMNGIPDDCDIVVGASTDRNGNGVPDECEPPADISGPLGPGFPDGCVDAFDLGTLLGAWCSAASDPDPPGDVDPPCEGCTSPNFALADISGPVDGVSDGCVDAFDLAKLLANWCSFLGGNPCGTCFR
ncbi:MAG: PQQ-dependent sugar dehydrogenase [Planctomycetes bacterium]|nr:PQQ-dependent sugar dehydrogenase [Planctomycetota bacterium]